MKELIRKEKGITLIALIITVIVMLILAGVAIGTLTGSNGLIGKVQSSTNKYNAAAYKEQLDMDITDAQMQFWQANNSGATMSDLAGILGEKGYNVTDNEDGTITVEKDGGTAVINSDFTTTVEGVATNTTTNTTTNQQETNTDTGVNNIVTPPVVVPPVMPPVVTPPTNNPATDPGNISTTAGSTGVIEIAWLDLNNNVIQTPLAPNVGTGMTKVYWGVASGDIDKENPSNNTVEIKEGDANFKLENWYNYTKQTGANDGHTSNWANVKITDGSYFVWIPRYAYKIIYFDNKDHANDYRINGLTSTNQAWITGYSTIYGMIDKNGKAVAGNILPSNAERVKTAGYTDYIPHPAFLDGHSDSYTNGEWDSELSGFWVAKYEMSGETNGSSSTPGNVAISSTIKMVSKPNVSSWVNINIANCYTNSLNYGSNIGHLEYNSHLEKNSECGAALYLTDSKYGRNGTEVTINNYYVGGMAKTGYAGGSISAGADFDGTNSYTYNTPQGQLASSTGNMTGMYDLNGGACEYVAAYNTEYQDNGSEVYVYRGSAFLDANGNNFAYILQQDNKKSTREVTAYSNSSTVYMATSFSDFTDGRNVSHVGDAMHEVWVSNSSNWFADCYPTFMSLGSPFLIRSDSMMLVYYVNSFYVQYAARRCELNNRVSSVHNLTLIVTR
ncbi:MAG: type II secretion system GspH family protein [Oscillospiraceae bacterium]|nr:type II secretion system GspH family protein [Oscillospiraceae bacterium]